jgi:hypothetical protein
VPNDQPLLFIELSHFEKAGRPARLRNQTQHGLSGDKFLQRSRSNRLLGHFPTSAPVG